ncbi:RNA polymerase sigma factor [Desulfitobacterium metallireducens]|uniref:Sigma-70 family RNA polymerase sigma factor n=1 Tax=Desulfitobacterium metallireducens DSM 15288 TaxID=871968 RepID=W0E9N6_9FIRM|nr:sigma-70 family RNA polymerase sigma factor [Desulfitobacterium metallireducens]AHF05939.1 sigma-70 family RNA polymerase sigma factor [Desulfitobacterium metallireducens DSM 15288]
MDDLDLIQQVLSGKHEYFAQLVERYQKPLIYFLRGILRDEEEVLDCTQEAFLAAYRNLWKYSSKYTFRAWLYTIARNKAIDLLRKKKKESPVSLNENLIDPQEGPEEVWLAKEQAGQLQEVLDELSEQYRQALYLRYQQEMSYEEMSLVLNIPVSLVKTHLYRGKEKLRQILERRGLDERNGQLVGPTISRGTPL